MSLRDVVTVAIGQTVAHNAGTDEKTRKVQRMTTTKRLVQASALASLVLLLPGCVALGLSEPEFCENAGSTSLMPWVKSTWEPYCEQLNNHLESPQKYELPALTTFFAEHPAKVEELKTKLARYDRPERCFSEPQEELQLRRLQTCMQTNDEQDARISTSWKIKAEPWLGEYQFRVKSLRGKLTKTKAIGDKIERKIRDKFENNTQMDQPELTKTYTDNMAKHEKEIAAIDKSKAQLTQLTEMSAANPGLATTITREFGPPIQVLLEDHEKNKKLYAELVKTRDFFVLATGSVGKACPAGKKARKELKIAKKQLTEELGKVSASSKSITVLTKINREDDEEGFSSKESFQGFICGKRSSKNQFEGRPEMCVQWFFTIQREKGQNEKKWEPWVVKKFTEGKANQGVDCALLK